MRKFVKSLLFLGCIMVFGAFALAVDQFATPERKEAFNSATGELADAMAETPEERTGRGRGKGLWNSIQALANGVFRSSPVVLAEIMPPAPEGWTVRDYTGADGRAFMGVGEDDGYQEGNQSHRTLAKFFEASESRNLGSAKIYESGDSVVMIRLSGSLDNFRKADAGTAAEKAMMLKMPRPPSDARLFMSVDGMPIGVLPQFTKIGDRRYPTGYRRFVFSMGRLVEGEVIARASDADLVALLGRIDVAAVQAALDAPTERFVMGKGVEWAGETPPSAELPPVTLAYRAHLLLRAEGGLDRADAEMLKAIARGEVTSWDDMAAIRIASPGASEDVVALLGPEPEGLAAVRMAQSVLIVERDRLRPHQKYLLGDISERRVTTQTELRAKSYWRDDWEPAFAAIIAMLPE